MSIPVHACSSSELLNAHLQLPRGVITIISEYHETWIGVERSDCILSTFLELATFWCSKKNVDEDLTLALKVEDIQIARLALMAGASPMVDKKLFHHLLKNNEKSLGFIISQMRFQHSREQTLKYIKTVLGSLSGSLFEKGLSIYLSQNGNLCKHQAREFSTISQKKQAAVALRILSFQEIDSHCSCHDEDQDYSEMGSYWRKIAMPSELYKI